MSQHTQQTELSSQATNEINELTNRKKISTQRLMSFAVISAITGLLALGGFTLLMGIYKGLDITFISRDWALVISEYISVIVSCLFSFSLNKKFTFSDRKARRAGIWLYIVYYFVVTPIGAWLMVVLVNVGLSEALAKLIKMSINLVTDFLYCRYFLFRYLKKKYDPTINEAFLAEELSAE